MSRAVFSLQMFMIPKFKTRAFLFNKFQQKSFRLYRERFLPQITTLVSSKITLFFQKMHFKIFFLHFLAAVAAATSSLGEQNAKSTQAKKFGWIFKWQNIKVALLAVSMYQVGATRGHGYPFNISTASRTRNGWFMVNAVLASFRTIMDVTREH